MGSWLWTPFTLALLKGFLIGTAPVITVAGELPVLTELCSFYLCIARFCLRQARQIHSETQDILLSDHPEQESHRCLHPRS